ncbi:LysR family transcriptional regulator [Paenibacillus massiliensis]|uniref:LysR family transcriptional regulator n=1 Tax=Paenibacillus massiliensis TaxID=225917 RepID=UPI0004702BD0|nr:LysR family transcriptional regulator [Paenibacillus massiliensis]
MESRHLFTFLVVVETGSFTKAALKLDYAQSSITSQIQALENELGKPLFDRIGRTIRLTTAGERLLPYAQEIHRMHAMAENALSTDVETSGTIRIGAPESLAAFRLPSIIREYRERYPQVRIILKPGLCWEMLSLLRAGDLDVAFILQPEAEERDLHIETLVQENMALIAAPNHPLAGSLMVEPGQLKEESILFTESGCSYRTLFERHLHQSGIVPDPSLEFWSIEAIKQCVANGLGLSFLPYITVHKEIQDGKLVRLNWNDDGQRVATQLVYHTKKWQSQAMLAFLETVRQHAPRWREEQAGLAQVTNL